MFLAPPDDVTVGKIATKSKMRNLSVSKGRLHLWMEIVLVPPRDLRTGVAKLRVSISSSRQSKPKMMRVYSCVVSICCEIEEALEEFLDAALEEWLDRVTQELPC